MQTYTLLTSTSSGYDRLLSMQNTCKLHNSRLSCSHSNQMYPICISDTILDIFITYRVLSLFRLTTKHRDKRNSVNFRSEMKGETSRPRMRQCDAVWSGCSNGGKTVSRQKRKISEKSLLQSYFLHYESQMNSTKLKPATLR